MAARTFVRVPGRGDSFYHTHIVNGIRITHSHPYSQTPDTGNHTHTTTGFATIAQLTLILMLAASFYASLRTFALRAARMKPCHTPIHFVRAVSVLSLRAPPVH
ncbi:MAG: hypothetical protein ACLR1G_06010 [Alistipes indistinctus]